MTYDFLKDFLNKNLKQLIIIYVNLNTQSIESVQMEIFMRKSEYQI